MKIIVTDSETAQVLIYSPQTHKPIRFGALLTYLRENHKSYDFILTCSDLEKGNDFCGVARKSKHELPITNQKELDYALQIKKKQGVLRLFLKPMEARPEFDQPAKSSRKKIGSFLQKKAGVSKEKTTKKSEHQGENLKEIIEGKVSEYLEKKIDRIIDHKLEGIINHQLSQKLSLQDKHNPKAKISDGSSNIYKIGNTMPSEEEPESFVEYYGSNNTKNQFRISDMRANSSTYTGNDYCEGQAVITDFKNYKVMDSPKIVKPKPETEKNLVSDKNRSPQKPRASSFSCLNNLHSGKVYGKGNYNIVSTNEVSQNDNFNRKRNIGSYKKPKSKSKGKILEEVRQMYNFPGKRDFEDRILIQISHKRCRRQSKSKSKKTRNRCNHFSAPKQFEQKITSRDGTSRKSTNFISSNSRTFKDSSGRKSNIIDQEISQVDIEKISKQFGVQTSIVREVLVGNWHLSSAEIAEKIRKIKQTVNEDYLDKSHNPISKISSAQQFQRQFTFQSVSKNQMGRNQKIEAFGFGSFSKQRKQLMDCSQLSKKSSKSGNKESLYDKLEEISKQFEKDLDEDEIPSPNWNRQNSKRQYEDRKEYSSFMFSMTENLMDSGSLKNPFKRNISKLPQQRESKNFKVPNIYQLNASNDVDFSKVLQRTEDLADGESKIGRKTPKEKGKIFMKMVEAFGQQYKSELFKFIEANEDLTESLMVRKWKNSHS